MLVLAPKDQDHIPCSFSYKLVCVDNKFSKPITLYRGENAFLNVLKQFLKSINTLKTWWKSISTKISLWLRKKKNIFDQLTHARYVKK